MNCAYIRLSEEDINKTQKFSESILNQIQLIEEYAKKNNIQINKKYIDDGYSGINFARPAFEKMLKDIEQKKIDTIITKDFSRLGREFIETSFYITRFFPEHNIRYIAINEDYDSIKKNNDAKEMMVGIKGIINDRYVKDTSKKIKAVKDQKTEEGYYLGFIAPFRI
ncbi:MAG: recombinase family protein [Clostridia bacterium]|nr:recombinase family protein [Clostridia bacterium]